MEKRRWKYVVVLGIVFLLPTVLSQSVPVEQLVKISYLEKNSIILTGNHTFSFLTSDTGTNDVKIEVNYNNVTNWSIVRVESLPLNITWQFKNDTKSYYYLDENTSKIYIVKVNYTSVKVPPNPYLVEIEELSKQLNSSKVNYTILLREYNNLSTIYEGMINDYKNMSQNRTNWLNQITLLKANLTNLNLQVNLLKDQVNQLKNDKEYWKNEYDKMETKYKELKEKWDDILTRVVLPTIIGFVVGIVVVKAYDSFRRNRLPSLSKLKTQQRKYQHQIQHTKCAEPKQVQSFKEQLAASNLGQQFIEAKKEPQWKLEVDAPEEKVYKFDKVELRFKKIRPEDTFLKDEAKYQHPVWRVYVDGEMYEDFIAKDEIEFEKFVEEYKKGIEESLKGEQ